MLHNLDSDIRVLLLQHMKEVKGYGGVLRVVKELNSNIYVPQLQGYKPQLLNRALLEPQAQLKRRTKAFTPN